MRAYSLPHEAEREGVELALRRLTPAQQRIVRSYVRNVLFGSLSLAEWCKQGDVPRVALSTWYRPRSKGGHYWGADADHDAHFRVAVEAYKHAWSDFEVEQDRKIVEQAGRTLRRASITAAATLVRLVSEGEHDRIKLDAAKAVLDRAAVETADKSPAASPVQIVIPDNGRDGYRATARAAD